LIAGGSFTSAGGTDAANIARWDGSSWNAIGSGIDGPVRAFTEHLGALVVGGNFHNAGGISARSIVRWTGDEWSDIGGVEGNVYALRVHNQDLYIGGEFQNAGGVTARNIVRWNGFWNPLGGGVTGGAVRAMSTYNGNLIVGGTFTQPYTWIARWDGVTWSSMLGIFSPVYAMANWNGLLYVSPSGEFRAWNGQSWTDLGTFAGYVFNVLVVYRNELIVGGSFAATPSPRVQAPNITRWDGSVWRPLGAGLKGAAYDMIEYEGELLAGGFFSLFDKRNPSDMLRWNGTSWTAWSGDFGINALIELEGDLIVAGGFHEINGVPAIHIAHWNGGEWLAFGDGLEVSNRGSGVQALVVYRNELVAAGDFDHSGSTSINHIARWDGTAWSTLGGGLGVSGNYAIVYDLAVFNDELIAGGTFSTADGVPANRIARWNGSEWAPLGNGLDRPAHALTVFDGALVAGGDFTIAGDVPANRIARWDGVDWSPLGDGVDGLVESLAVHRGELVAGGSFLAAGGQSTPGLAKWDGNTWSGLGTGIYGRYDQIVNALYTYNGDLWVGGEFTVAGGQAASSIARWVQLRFRTPYASPARKSRSTTTTLVKIRRIPTGSLPWAVAAGSCSHATIESDATRASSKH
jgi:hypothetical protein